LRRGELCGKGDDFAVPRIWFIGMEQSMYHNKHAVSMFDSPVYAKNHALSRQYLQHER